MLSSTQLQPPRAPLAIATNKIEALQKRNKNLDEENTKIREEYHGKALAAQQSWLEEKTALEKELASTLEELNAVKTWLDEKAALEESIDVIAADRAELQKKLEAAAADHDELLAKRDHTILWYKEQTFGEPRSMLRERITALEKELASALEERDAAKTSYVEAVREWTDAVQSIESVEFRNSIIRRRNAKRQRAYRAMRAPMQ